MTSFLEDWLTVLVVATLGMVSPGPNFAITIKNSLLHSRLAGMWTALGVAVGNLVHVVFRLLGIALIVSQSILLFNALKWFGVAYLAYIGLKSLLARREDVEEIMQSRHGGARELGSSQALWALPPPPGRCCPSRWTEPTDFHPVHTNFGEFPFRNCPKRGSETVAR
jgi:threonine/homoserine/homoserine lactone efflux protein